MKRASVLVAVLTVALALACPVSVGASPSFPASVPLPDGFYPEGIAIGSGHDFYVGSLLDGALYKGDLRTGEGEVLAEGSPGRLVAGLSFDGRSGLLWGVGFEGIAGVGFEGGAGRAFAFDSSSGQLVAAVDVPGTLLNDIVVTRDAAYLTDSLDDVLWTIPLDRRGRPAGPARSIALGGDFTFVSEGLLPINLNGIVASRDGQLIAVHSTLGLLYKIDPLTGTATQIDLGPHAVPSGDGIVLHGSTLYVVQNFLNRVAVVSLDPDLASGRVTKLITSGLFRIPTTAARFGSSLYLVNARFDAAFPPVLGGMPMSIDYDVVRVRR